MVAEGELRGNADDSDKVHDLQNKVADLKAEVKILITLYKINFQANFVTVFFSSLIWDFEFSRWGTKQGLL